MKITETEIAKRLASEKPEFFKKTQKIGWFLTTIISPLLLLTPFTAPFSLLTASVGGTIVALSQLTSKGVSNDEAKKLIEESERLKNEIENLKKLRQ